MTPSYGVALPFRLAAAAPRVFSASEEPFALRGWRSSEDPDSLAARLAADWGVAAASCKGCKARGDFSLGQDNFLLAKLANEWKA